MRRLATRYIHRQLGAKHSELELQVRPRKFVLVCLLQPGIYLSQLEPGVFSQPVGGVRRPTSIVTQPATGCSERQRFSHYSQISRLVSSMLAYMWWNLEVGKERWFLTCVGAPALDRDHAIVAAGNFPHTQICKSMVGGPGRHPHRSCRQAIKVYRILPNQDNGADTDQPRPECRD
jgi:hypothetical protein